MTVPLFSLAGRTALVTGASSGLGWRFAECLAGAGARVALAARRKDRLETLAGELRAKGATVAPVVLDVTDRAAIAPALDAAEAALGPIDILINSAGVASGSYFTKISEADWRAVMDVNLDGVFRVAQEAARRMSARQTGGSIINIASIAGLGVLKAMAPYAASKAAVIQLTKAMALELARDRIRVNAIAPGYVSTELNAAFLASDAGKKLAQRIPFQRFGEPHELDGALLLLASDAGAYITGTVITVDGGSLLALG